MSLASIRYKNKRDYIRMDVKAGIQCRIIETGEEFSGTCNNLSHTGIQFETSKYVKEGTEAQITVNVIGGAIKPLNARLLVKRVIKENNDNYIVSGELKDVR